jgi:predicted RNase H-like nuclease
MSEGPVVGVDWYKAGWVAVVLDPHPHVVVERDLAALIASVDGVTCVGVDMPIGLPTDGCGRPTRLRARSSARGATASS